MLEFKIMHQTAEISNFGTHKSVCRYLGKYLSLKKSERKSILIKKIKEQASIYWKVIRAIPIQPARIVAMIHKSISAFHFVPAVLSDDISRNDIVNIYNKILRSFFGVPATYSSLLLNALHPIESPFSWIFRIAM